MLRLPRDATLKSAITLLTIRGAVQRNDLIISIFHFQFAIPLSRLHSPVDVGLRDTLPTYMYRS